MPTVKLFMVMRKTMTIVEALIAAFEATKDHKYLDRAKVLATPTFTEKLTVEQKKL
jgi:mannose/cellobiose epimerase-like protein (N-acyl-D-glucosamine 2-epimerase family)